MAEGVDARREDGALRGIRDSPASVQTYARPVEGRLRYCVTAWRALTHDQWVRDVVTTGYLPVFEKSPPLCSAPPNWCARPRPQMANEVIALLEKGAICRVENPTAPGFYSPVFRCYEGNRGLSPRFHPSHSHPIHADGGVQHGFPSTCSRSHAPGRVAHFPGPRRCVPSCAGASGVSQVSPVCASRRCLPLRGSAVRPVYGSRGFSRP